MQGLYRVSFIVPRISFVCIAGNGKHANQTREIAPNHAKIVMAMAAIGLNTNLVKRIKNSGKPILVGFCCWVCIAGVRLLV